MWPVIFGLLLHCSSAELNWRCVMLARFSRLTFSRDSSKVPTECIEEEGTPFKLIGSLPPPPFPADSFASAIPSTSAADSISSSAASALQSASNLASSASSFLTSLFASTSSSSLSPFSSSSSSNLPSVKSLPPVSISSHSDRGLIVENGFVRIGLNTKQSSIDILEGNFEGAGIYTSALSKGDKHGFRTEDVTGIWLTHKQSVDIITETKQNVTIMLKNEIETWVFQLLRGERVFTLRVSGTTQVQHSLYTDPLATYAFFSNKGVVQMMDSSSGKNHLSSTDSLVIWYAISGTDAPACVQLRVITGTAAGVVLENTECCDPNYKTGNVKIEQAFMTNTARALPYHSAIHVYPQESPAEQTWGKPPIPPSSVLEKTYELVYEVGITDGNFPTHSIPSGVINLPSHDIRGLLSGIYSSPVGAIRTFDHPGLMTPTIWRPEPSYEGDFNFFDPDCFFALSAVIYSGDPYLQDQARTILERTVQYIRDDGLMPHHLVLRGDSTTATYTAISGATQPGPNIFWTMACLQYANATGNLEWLEKTLPLISRAVDYVLKLIPTAGLVDAPGPLMIDTLIRTGYTTDTNAALVWLLQHLEPMYRALGKEEKAKRMAEIARSVSLAMNEQLWEANSNDHYVTAIDPHTKNVLDMVDYDANLVAVVAGVSNRSQSAAILKRIDKGECSHKNGRGTWVSEVRYDASKVYRGDTGDSFKMLARIAWFDGHARKRVGDKEMFDKILDPIVDDLLKYLWLNERYNCEGERSRGYGFIFYPSVAAMLLREVRYGLNVGLSGIDVLPMHEGFFSYHVGNTHIDYSTKFCRLELVGRSDRTLTFQILLRPGTAYLVSAIPSTVCKERITEQESDDLGVLRFSAAGNCVIEVSKI